MPLRSCESEPDLLRMQSEAGEDGRPAVVPGRVVGIDPGLNATGYAVVEPSPRGPRIVEAGVIRPSSEGKAMGQRLTHLHQNLLEILDEFRPSAVAIERVHSHVKFPRTAILMSQARGVILLAAALRGIPVFGYAAARIKKTLTGSGRAPKPQMQQAIKVEFRLDSVPEPHDVADACAVALCHVHVSPNLSRLDGV
ncbi:Crossover junction endodeoxyribonuclease RuvC [Aquisphaera giovannonii]|uniref:Crossover junction endodeoxyribonuclease RuvC n=1 Tax=Aquisphaera giovannonii TaxID=406548 RepID=A0A5B9WA27_9BACT|nr:crossover junction endodeoxyribonuclease RuvC [Aquisphaera giovannonii]QEH36945.1 Crossover junction endodeoxyribonuclease RuvC [Aquisphaera giovannonii]